MGDKRQLVLDLREYLANRYYFVRPDEIEANLERKVEVPLYREALAWRREHEEHKKL